MIKSNEKRQIRIGMIGYKFMGKAHSHAYRDLPFFFDLDANPVLQAISGRDKEGIKLAADKLGWKTYETDWKRLLERDDIDAIDIVTPNHTHAEIAIAAAEAGKHIICEKPLSMNIGEARRMLEAAQKNKVVHMICHNYRYAPAVQFAKKLINDGRLGRIYHIRASFLKDGAMNPKGPATWRMNKQTAGSGALGDLMAHSIDLARFLIGEFSGVSGVTETFINQRPYAKGDPNGEADYSVVDVDDAVAFVSRFANGAMGVFEATRFAKGNRNGNRFEINGSKGAIRWDFMNMNDLELYLEDDEKGLQGYRTINCTENEHPYASAYWPVGHLIGYEHTFTNLLSEFINGIASGINPEPNFEDGLRTQEVLEAVELSAKEKRWASLHPCQ
jgi:predicted dehydrogenase